MVAAQAVGGAAGNMVAVHNVVAASATVGLIGREGELIRRTSIPMLVYSLAAGALAFVGLAVVVVMIRRSPGKPLPGLEAGAGVGDAAGDAAADNIRSADPDDGQEPTART